MGGGFQSYWQQNRDGSPETYQFRKMQDIISFCKERKAFTFQGEIVPQIGLLYSTYAWKRTLSNSLYSSQGQAAIKGVLNMLLDSRLPVEILMDHQLNENLQQYPLLIIPEWKHIDPIIRSKLNGYINNGGNVLVIGADAVQDFGELLAVKFDEPLQKSTGIIAGYNSNITVMHTDYQPVTEDAKLQQWGKTLTADDWRFTTKHILASAHKIGKGKVAGIFMDMGDFYNHNQNPLSLSLLQAVIQSMVPSFISEVKGREKFTR